MVQQTEVHPEGCLKDADDLNLIPEIHNRRRVLTP